jgi:hypothetical protein
MLNLNRHTTSVAFLLVGAAAAAADRPLREVRSENRQFLLRIGPGQAGRAGRSCLATLFQQPDGARQGRQVWERALVNDVAPALALVRNDGRFVVTLDEYRRGGARHALVIYGSRGELLRHFLLTDLLDKSDWPQVKATRDGLVWLRGARLSFDDRADQFVAVLAWGRTIRVDLKTLQVVRGQAQGQPDVLAAVPPDVLAQILGHLEPDEGRVIAERLAELAQMTPEEQAQAQAIAEQLASERKEPSNQTAPEVAGSAEDSAAGQQAADAGPQSGEPGAGPAAAAETSELSSLAPEDQTAEPGVAGDLASPAVPAPSIQAPVDYVAWLNDLGQVEGPDASPVYQAAIQQHVPWEGDSDLLSAATRGDPEALESPQVQSWLAANAQAVATFREASRYDVESREYRSQDGSMIGVVLPDLSPLRELARATVMTGRRLAAEGRPAEAAECFMDALAAGAHTGSGLTLIENLVGTAMQGSAAEGYLDLLADTQADADLNYVQLAAEAEAAYRPVRSPVEALQFERASFLDTVQRLWSLDPQTGQQVLNLEKVREVLSYSREPSNADIEELRSRLADIGFEETVATGNAYYDALTTALPLPYPQASARLEELERPIGSDESLNPLLAHLLPSLSRYSFISTRGETTRRASLLVTSLRAYRQQHGEYPASLAALGDQEFVVDPFSQAQFVYRRAGNDFVLYSVGGNGQDDAGIHDRKGETSDLVYWPRPK